jgi:regulator of protease activity HflC (stomatin/prohibitin superfamily)
MSRDNDSLPIVPIIVAVVFVLAAAGGGCIACTKLTKVGPGYIGVSVQKCGSVGVSKAPIPTGYYWRELFCEDVVMYPISMQSLILTKNPHEGTGGTSGNEIDQSISVTSSEGLLVATDIALNFTIDAAKAPMIYERWRSDIEDIEHKYIRQTIREALQSQFAKYTAEDLYSAKKETARADVEKYLRDKLEPYGFMISQFTVNRIEPPKAVIDAINAKVAMIQQAQQAEQAVRKKQAEAAQAVAEAEGKAKSNQAEAAGEAAAITMKAEAQAKANKVLADSITPQLIEYEKMRKWNGTLPQFTGNMTPLIQVK